MECYEKNLESIKNQKKYKKLYEYLRSREELSEDGQEETDGISFGVSEVEGRPVLYAVKREGEEEQLFQLDSLYDEAALTKLWCAGQKKIGSYQMKYIFCGFGNGLYVRAVLDRADDTAKILVYEPSAELFRFVLRNFDLSGLLSDERLTVVVEEYYERNFEEELYRVVTYSDLENLVYQAYPNYEKLYSAKVKEADQIIQIMYNSVRATQNVLDRYGVSYTENGLLNIKHFLESRSILDFYRKIDKSIPVIIVAAGPSLDKNIEVLKQAKGKCLLVGLDTSLKALLKHGILADIFVSVDARKHINHFTDDRVVDIPMICELSSNVKVLDRIKAKKYFINDMNAYINEFFSERGILFPVFTTGGSVANTACAIFSSMGFQRIIMVGQDLAYTNNMTHSVDTLRGAWKEDAGQMDGFMVDGYYGDKVKTSYEFQLYLEWFEEEIKKNPDVEFIDATEGGAMIHGAKNMPLQAVVDQYCIREIDIAQELEGVEVFLSGELKKAFAEHIMQIEPKLREMRYLAEKAARNYGKMKELVYKDAYYHKSWRRLFEEAKQIGERLEKETVMIYVHNLVQRKTTAIMEHINETKTDIREEIITTCDIGESYLKQVIAEIDSLIKVGWIAEAQKAVEKIE